MLKYIWNTKSCLPFDFSRERFQTLRLMISTYQSSEMWVNFCLPCRYQLIQVVIIRHKPKHGTIQGKELKNKWGKCIVCISPKWLISRITTVSIGFHGLIQVASIGPFSHSLQQGCKDRPPFGDATKKTVFFHHSATYIDQQKPIDGWTTHLKK